MNPVHLADRVSTLRPTAVNRVLREVRQLQAQGRSVVSLMRGQPDTPTPPHIVEAAERALRDGRTGYPDNQGEPSLRRAVAEKLQREQNLTYDPDREILITDGATLGICTALGAIVQPEVSVMLPDPIYDAYAAPIALWGGSPSPGPRHAPRRPVHDWPVQPRAVLESERQGSSPQHTLEPGWHGPDARKNLQTSWGLPGTAL